MSKLNSILQRIETGAPVRIVHDSYGQKHVEVKRAWLPLRHQITLNREELSLVEVALSARTRRGKEQTTVKL